MADAAVYLGALMVAMLGVYRIPLARRHGLLPAVRHGTVFVLAQATSMLVSAPGSLGLLDRLPGSPGLPDLCSDLLRMEAARALLLLANHLPWPAPPRQQSAGTLDRSSADVATPPLTRLLRSRLPLAAAALLALFAHTSWQADREIAPDDASRLLLALYDALILCYSCGCLLHLSAALNQCIHGMARGPLRQGLTWLRRSVWIGVAWAAWGLDDIAVVLRNGSQETGQDLISGLLGIACLATAVTGASARLWSAGALAARNWLADYRRYRALTPQWKALYRRLPSIALRTPTFWVALLPPRDAHFALYRRIIEIHDAHLALGQTTSLSATCYAASGRTRAPSVEALHTEADRLLHEAEQSAKHSTRNGLPPM